MPTSAHARCRAGYGEEWGRTQHARNPATLPLANPQPHRVHHASIRGPVSAIAGTSCPLSGGGAAHPRSVNRAESPHIVCSGTMHACGDTGPPSLPFLPPPLLFGRGGCGGPRPPRRRALHFQGPLAQLFHFLTDKSV